MIEHDQPWTPPKKLVIPHSRKPWEIGTVQSVRETDSGHTEVVLRLDDSALEMMTEWLGEDLWLELVEEK